MNKEKVSKDIDNIKFNTAISALMILLNEYENGTINNKADTNTFFIILIFLCY